MSQITDKKSHLYLLHYILHLIWIMILYDVDMCICSFFSLVASVYIEVSQICCTCFWLFFVRRMTNICSEVMIFNFFEREKLDSNTRSLLIGEKISSLFKTHACLFFTFFLSEEMSQITDKSLIKICCTWFWLSFVRKTTNAQQ